MYLPAHFAQHDTTALHALMATHPLATLVTPSPDGTTADLVPLRLHIADESSTELRGHVARANPLWRHADGHAVLVLFHGPQAYVTPSWYASKPRHGKVVPTWNYTVVQARGTLHAVDDAPWLRELVGLLTDTHEGPRARPWAVHDAPDDYVQQMLGAIVGIRIEVAELVGKWKVSQNRDEADRAGVAAGLAADPGQAEMAHLVATGGTPPR
jgi:transcriptional regulator